MPPTTSSGGMGSDYQVIDFRSVFFFARGMKPRNQIMINLLFLYFFFQKPMHGLHGNNQYGNTNQSQSSSSFGQRF